jgi:hypothetical protein
MGVHLQMMADHESQFFEWLPWVTGDQKVSLKNPVKDRKAAVWKLGGERTEKIAKRFARELKRKYGRPVKSALAYQVSEYGRPASAKELQRLFPF